MKQVNLGDGFINKTCYTAVCSGSFKAQSPLWASQVAEGRGGEGGGDRLHPDAVRGSFHMCCPLEQSANMTPPSLSSMLQRKPSGVMSAPSAPPPPGGTVRRAASPPACSLQNSSALRLRRVYRKMTKHLEPSTLRVHEVPVSVAAEPRL